MDQFVLVISKSRLDDLLKQAESFFRVKASDDELLSLTKSYACYVTIGGSTFFDTKLVSKILFEQVKNNYFNGSNSYSINFKLKNIVYSVSPGDYGNECHYIVRSSK